MKEDGIQRMKRRLLGLEGPLDKRQWHEVDGILAGSATHVFFLTCLLLLVSLTWDAYSHQRVTVSFGSMALFAVFMYQTGYVGLGVRRNETLRQTPLPSDEHARRLRVLKKQAILGGVGWGVMMSVLMNGILPWAAGIPLKMNAVSITIWLAGGVFFGGAMYLLGRRKLGQCQAG